MKNFAIEIEGLSKFYQLNDRKKTYALLSEEMSSVVRGFGRKKNKTKKFWALKNINLKVEQGDVVGIIGPNGAGKSTLLKILSQITFPSTGKVVLRGKVVSLLEVGTGFNPELTGRENIYLNGSILGMTRDEINSKMDEIVNFSGVEKFLDEPVKHYSSGMYIRLAFSIAAFLDSEILLIDEVLAVGDANFQKKSLGKVNDITKENKRTVIFVSHDLNAIGKLCNKVVLIDKGKIIKIGRPKDIIKKYLSQVTADSTYKENYSGYEGRLGTHEIIIDKVELLGLRGTKVKTLKTGDPFRLRIYYKIKSENTFNNVMVGFLLKTDWDAPVFVQQNILEKVDFGEIKKDGYFEFLMDSFPVAPGSYILNCSIIKNSGIGGQYYDNIDNVVKFEVQSSDFFGSGILPSPDHGSIYLRGKWSHK